MASLGKYLPWRKSKDIPTVPERSVINDEPKTNEERALLAKLGLESFDSDEAYNTIREGKDLEGKDLTKEDYKVIPSYILQELSMDKQASRTSSSPVGIGWYDRQKGGKRYRRRKTRRAKRSKKSSKRRGTRRR